MMGTIANEQRRSLPSLIWQGAGLLLAVPLAGFFGFVGFMKATAPISELAIHEAWTVHIPQAIGRLVGVSEVLCAAALLAGAFILRAGKAATAAAAVLIVNVSVAAWVHYRAGELDHLPQNAALAAMLGLAALSIRQRASAQESKKGENE